MRRRAAGFTLMEIVMAMAIASVVMMFASLFVMAPLNAWQAQEQRATLAASGAEVWPALQRDLDVALPNSIRVRRNGSFVAVELLEVVGFARYKTPPGASFTIAGTQGNEFPGVTLPFDSTAFYLSVNNLGTGGAASDAYALGAAMTPAGTRIEITDGAVDGEANITLTPAPALGASPRSLVYLVRGPVTWLCDETAGTVRRYAGYGVAANQTSWDTTAEFAAAGMAGELMASGITACDAAVSAPDPDRSQTLSLHLTATHVASGESVRLLHASLAEYRP